MRAPPRPRPARPPRSIGFPWSMPVEQGAWLEDGYVVYRAGRGAATESVMPLRKIPLKGAHNVENVLAAVVAARLAGAPAERDSPGRRELPGGRAPPGVRGHDQRRGVLQRLQGHQRGRDRQGRGRVRLRHSSDPGRQGQGLRLHRCLRRCCASGCAPSTPSARRRPRSSRNCAGWSPSTPARRWTTR